MSQPACTCSEPGAGHEITCKVGFWLREGTPLTAQDLDRAVAQSVARGCVIWLAAAREVDRREREGEL